MFQLSKFARHYSPETPALEFRQSVSLLIKHVTESSSKYVYSSFALKSDEKAWAALESGLGDMRAAAAFGALAGMLEETGRSL